MLYLWVVFTCNVLCLFKFNNEIFQYLWHISCCIQNKENKGIFVAAEAKKVEVFVPQTVKLHTKDLKAEREKALAKRLQKQQQADGKLGKFEALYTI